MEKDLYKNIVNNAPFGHAYHKIILDETGIPIDYIFLEANVAFGSLTGLEPAHIIGKTATEVIPNIKEDPFNWISFYGKIATEGGTEEFEQFFSIFNKWYKITVSSPKPLHFSTLFLDITTEKNRADELERFFSINLDLLCIADTDGHFLQTNEAWSDILGYSKKDLEKRTFLEFIHPDDLEQTLETLKTLNSQENIVNFVNRYRGKDGTWHFIEWHSRPHGKVIYAAARDITDRLKAEQSIRESLGNLVRSEEISGTGSWVWMIETDIVEGSAQFYAILGMPPQDVMSIHDFAQYIMVEDQKRIIQEIQTAVQRKKPVRIEIRAKTPAGIPVTLETLAEPEVNKDGKVEKLVGVIRDITESVKQKKATEIRLSLVHFATNHSVQELIQETLDLLSALIESPIGFYHFIEDDQTSISLQQWSTNTKATFCTASPPGSHYHIEKAGVWADSLRTRKTVIHNDYPNMDGKKGMPEGHPHLTREMVIPVFRNNKIVAILGFGNKKSDYTQSDSSFMEQLADTTWDIVQQKVLEDSLRNAKEEAEQANKAKSEFLSNMSHEIRTPLNSIIGFSDLLHNTPLTSTQQIYTENVLTSAHSLLTIINDILDISKIEAGKMDIELLRTDIIEIVEQATDIVKYQASKKGLEVLLNISLDIPHIAFVDPTRLRQILINLLGNAVKFTHFGEIELSIVFSAVTETEGVYNFTIRDTGIGITEEQKVKLFKAFSQADSSTTRKYGGTGLGLSISSMLAKRMNSKIEFTSEAGEGSQFFFALPCTYEPGNTKKQTEDIPVKRVLIADDNESNRIILQQSLKFWGVEVVAAENGTKTLETLKNDKSFDLLIIDYHMPHLNGLQTVAKIRQELKLDAHALPVILLYSAYNETGIAEASLAVGIMQTLQKPLKTRDLMMYIHKLSKKNYERKIEYPQERLTRPKQHVSENSTIEEILCKMLQANDLSLLDFIITERVKIESTLGTERAERLYREVADLHFNAALSIMQRSGDSI